MNPTLPALVSQVECLLPAQSVLRHLIRIDRPVATVLISLCYAHAGEPKNLSTDEFTELAERVAQRVCARWEIKC